MAGSLLHRVGQYRRGAFLDRFMNTPVNRIVDQVQGIQAARNQKKLSTYNSVGVPPTYLQSGPQSINFIVNGQIGQITRAWFQFNITVSNSPVTLLPAFMWVDRIHSYKDSTNSKGMESTWVSNLISYGNMTPSQFVVMGKSMLCDPRDAWTVEPLQPATYTVYIPLFDTTLFTGANLKYYPERMNLTIDGPSGGCIEQGVAANVILNSAALVLEETEVPSLQASSIEASHMGVVQRVFLDWLSLAPQNITVGPGGSQVSITLSGIEGVTPFLVFGLRNAADSSAAGGGVKRFVRIGANTTNASVALLTPSYGHADLESAD